MNIRRFAATAASTFALSGALFTAPSQAVTFDILTGNGFVSRGDVVSHPKLGKYAINAGGDITFSKDGAHWEQTCVKTTGQNQEKVFQKGLSNVNFTVTYRSAPGNDNITGYKITSLGGGVSQPDTLCTGSWTRVADTRGNVTLVSGRNLPPMLWYNYGGDSGAWYYLFQTDPTLPSWGVVL